MIQAETFVGSLAICLGIALGITALTSNQNSLSLRIVRAVRMRFGESAARAFVVLIATLLLLLGVMILRNMRPEFAAPPMNIRDSPSSPTP